MDSLLIAVILQIVSLSALLLIVRAWLNRQKTQAISLLKAYFETNDPDEPSQFAGFVDIITSQFSSKLVSSIRAQLNQASSVISRNQNSVNGALAEDMIGQLPLAGAAMSAFPALAKLVKKNPMIAGLVQGKIEEIIAKQMGGAAAAAAPAGSNGGGGSPGPLTIN